MTRVANYAQHLLNLSYLSATQTRIKDSQIAVSSGKVAQGYDKLGVDAHQLLSLERSSVRAEQYVKNIDRAIGRLDITESTLATMTDRATYLLGQLAISINADNADSVALDEIGGGFLQEVASLLNVRHGDRYLFAGSRGDIAPVDLTGYDPTATWPPAAPGAVDTSYYQGNGVTAVARADDSFELDYGTTADQDGFEKLMRALSYTKWAGLNPADPNRAAVLSAALDLTREAIGDLSRIRSVCRLYADGLPGHAKPGHTGAGIHGGGAGNSVRGRSIHCITRRAFCSQCGAELYRIIRRGQPVAFPAGFSKPEGFYKQA